MTEHVADTIYNFLDEYCNYYKKTTVFLLKKHNKILADDLEWLTNSLSEEQAILMNNNALEQKRLQLFKAMGLENYTAEMLVENAPESHKKKLEIVCNQFSEHIKEIKRINKITTEIVERKLASQQDLVKKAGILKRPQTYNMAGNKIKAHTETTIIGDY